MSFGGVFAVMDVRQSVEVAWSPSPVPSLEDGEGSVGSRASSVFSSWTGVSDSSAEHEPGSYWFNTEVVLLTWSHSKIEDAELFHKLLREKVDESTQIFGVQERHKNGVPHYHAVLKFPKRTHVRNVRERFKMVLEDGTVDTEAIRASLRHDYQRIDQYIKNTCDYLRKDAEGVLFGTEIECLSRRETLKRSYQEVIEEESYEVAKRKLMEIDPKGFVKNYNNNMAFLNGEKRRKVSGWVSQVTEWRPWKLPVEMEAWKQENILTKRVRPVPLIVVGEPRWGKTEWAVSAGERPLVMTKAWNLANYRDDATHVVLNDIDFQKFGSGGLLYWREVLGCQSFFDASDKYARKQCLSWGFPLIITCNWDNDPRLVPEIARYLEHAPCVVVELDGSLISDK